MLSGKESHAMDDTDSEVRANTRVSQVWVRAKSGWRTVGIQFSPLAEPAGAN